MRAFIFSQIRYAYDMDENKFNNPEKPMYPNVTPEEDALLKKHWGDPNSIDIDESTLKALDQHNTFDKDR